MPLLPVWAPNLHPLVVHFPIALLIVAVIGDLVDTVFQRPAWMTAATTSLYVLGTIGAVVAYMSGQQAAETVLVPGMAHPVIDAHRTWALAAMSGFFVLTLARVALAFRIVPETRIVRVLLLVLAIAGVVALQQTAERGARLVYEFGVGVIGSPGER